jgi:hypothetical protein
MVFEENSDIATQQTQYQRFLLKYVELTVYVGSGKQA